MSDFKKGDEVVLIDNRRPIFGMSAAIGSEAVVKRGGYRMNRTSYIDVRWTKKPHKDDPDADSRQMDGSYPANLFKLKKAEGENNG